ncbi:hypothetical protein KV100_04060 [Mumia sp. zg.B21]|uniref:hypothetical protein n=1 Tax=Mumia sp. zg.B21 TaxID=2855447 RepID=UPI001C6E4862|nr:hypothetical protein [Mumia sp. zg.B21]MBW9208820.1 hypothetical protein [Mumia sp. zg.B21]
MAPFYEVADTTATHAAGQRLAGLSGDVQQAKSTLVTALEAVTPGSRHGVGDVTVGVDAFQTWAVETSNAVANGVSNLGNNTSNGAKTVAQTSNETTALQNQQSALNRDVNSGSRQPVTAG